MGRRERRREEKRRRLGLVGGEKGGGGEGERLGSRKRRKEVGGRNVHHVFLAFFHRIDIQIVPMIIQDFISLSEGIYVIGIRGHFSFTIGNVLMGPAISQEGWKSLTSGNVFMNNMVIQDGGEDSFPTNKDTSSNRCVVEYFFHHAVPGHTNLSHEIPSGHLRGKNLTETFQLKCDESVHSVE